MSFSRPIFDRLPLFYRESPGLLEPLSDVADELMSLFHLQLRREEERIVQGRAPARLLSSKSREGTVEEVLSWLRGRCGASPRVWTGFFASRLNTRGAEPSFELRRSPVPSAMLAWEKEQLPASPPDFDIPEELLPVGVNVEAALARRSSWRTPPVVGEKILGEVFWRRGVRKEAK